MTAHKTIVAEKRKKRRGGRWGLHREELAVKAREGSVRAGIQMGWCTVLYLRIPVEIYSFPSTKNSHLNVSREIQSLIMAVRLVCFSWVLKF